MRKNCNDLEEIESSVLRFKQIIDLFIGVINGFGDRSESFVHLEHTSVQGYRPVQNFDDQEKYPLEFQVYMRQIGEMILAFGQAHQGTLERPLKIIDQWNDPKNYGDDGNLLWTLGENLDLFDSENLVEASEFGGNYFRDPPLRVSEVRVCAIDSHTDLGFFDCSEVPYVFRTQTAPDGCSFLDWWVEKFCYHLESTLLFMKGGEQTQFLKKKLLQTVKHKTIGYELFYDYIMNGNDRVPFDVLEDYVISHVGLSWQS